METAYAHASLMLAHDRRVLDVPLEERPQSRTSERIAWAKTILPVINQSVRDAHAQLHTGHQGIRSISPTRRSLGAKSGTVKCLTKMVTQKYVTRFAMQAAEATTALAIVGRLHDKAKIERNTLIALRSLMSRRGRLIGFVELGLEAD